MNPVVLFDSDPEMATVDVTALRDIVTTPTKRVTDRGRALLELGRRTRTRPDLREEVVRYVRDEGNANSVTIGTITVSQLGLAGLVASGSPESIRQAKVIAGETGPHGEEDLRRLVRSLGGTWPTSTTGSTPQGGPDSHNHGLGQTE
jgi:hypothetical protein